MSWHQFQFSLCSGRSTCGCCGLGIRVVRFCSHNFTSLIIRNIITYFILANFLLSYKLWALFGPGGMIICTIGANIFDLADSTIFINMLLRATFSTNRIIFAFIYMMPEGLSFITSERVRYIKSNWKPLKSNMYMCG